MHSNLPSGNLDPDHEGYRVREARTVKKATILMVVLVISVASGLFIFWKGLPTSGRAGVEVKGSGPLEKIVYVTVDEVEQVTLAGAQGASLAQIAKPSLFGEFKPGMNFDDAAKRFGPPAETRKLEDGTEQRLYRQGTVTVAVANERGAWVLFAYPGKEPLEVKDLIALPVWEQLRAQSRAYILKIRTALPAGDDFWITVDQGRVREIRWAAAK
jgi:hypothetical protein